MIKSIKDFFKLLSKKQKKQFLHLQILVLFMAIFETVSVFSVAPFIFMISNIEFDFKTLQIYNYIKFLNINNHKDLIIFFGIFILIIFFISTLISTYTINKLILFGYDCSSKFSTLLFKYYLSNDWKYHTKSNSSKLIKNISQECDRVSDGIARQILMINARSVSALFIILGLIVYNYALAIISFTIFSFCYFIIYSFAKRRLIFHGKNITAKQSIRYNILSDTFGSIRDIILFNQIETKTRIFESYSDNLAYSRGISAVITIVPKYFIEFIAFSLIIIITIALFFFYDGNISTILTLVSIFGLSSLKILPAFQAVYLCISILRNNVAALDEIKEDIYEYKIQKRKFKFQTNTKNSLEFNKNIVFEKVNFGYSDKNIIFKDLDLVISKSNKIGIIGQTGIGKSTFLNILCGLYKVDSGKILIDDILLDERNISFWQKKISLADQNVFITDGSILSNITLGNNEENIDLDLINRLLKIVQLDSYVSRLDKGINTNLGERGALISAGQKQRIGIARALYRRPQLLVLDEATNALDFEIEEKIYKNIFSEYKNINIIIISHRKISLKYCDKIYRLNNKKLETVDLMDIE